MRYDTLRDQKIFKEATPEKDRATMRWHDKDPAVYSEASLSRSPNFIKSSPKRGAKMEKITIYEKPTCTTCRNVHAALKESGVDFAAVNYYVEPISKPKLKELLSKMGISAFELVRKKEDIYKELKLSSREVTEGELIDLMAKHPDLIERPIVEQGKRAILARPAERIKEFLK